MEVKLQAVNGEGKKNKKKKKKKSPQKVVT